jgi:hypothetical protein
MVSINHCRASLIIDSFRMLVFGRRNVIRESQRALAASWLAERVDPLWEFETLNFLISRSDKNARIAPKAEVRYTAGPCHAVPD